MTSDAAIGSTPLDDFLDDAGASSDTGELLQQLGLLGSLIGITLAGGLVVFLALVHRGTVREVSLLIRVAGAAGVVALIGAAVEVAGVASIDDLSWSDALTDADGSAPMIRLLAGLLIVFGLFEHTVPADGSLDPSDADHGGRQDVRWVPASAFGYVGLLIGMISFWFDGHTVSEGPRVVHAAVDLVHVVAGSVWFGGVAGLAAIAWLRRGTGTSIARAVVRFSSDASVALVLVALAASLLTLMIIDGFGDLTGTDWGRLLLVKIAAALATAAIGGYNHFVVVPAFDRAGSVAGEARARTAVTVEAVLLLFVVAVTVFLTAASVN